MEDERKDWKPCQVGFGIQRRGNRHGGQLLRPFFLIWSALAASSSKPMRRGHSITITDARTLLPALQVEFALAQLFKPDIRLLGRGGVVKRVRVEGMRGCKGILVEVGCYQSAVGGDDA